MTTAYIALLRGINVGANKRVPMHELAGGFESAGCSAVRTYIQSGNVVFRASSTVARNASKAVTQRWNTAVLLRTATEWKAVVRDNPFALGGRADTALHVLFFEHPVPPEFAATFDLAKIAPDQIAMHGREMYLHLPNGVAASNLLKNGFNRKLNVVCTMRNWRTTTKLLELASARP